MFLKSVSQIQEKEAHALWSITFTEHQAAVTRVCGLLFLVQISCWTPYSVLCLWTTILPPETLNVYFTLIPSIACKVRIIMSFVQNHFIISSAITSSECHGCLVEPSEVDKIMSICCIQPINCVFNRVTAGYFYLKRGKTGPMPAELFDYKYVLITD